MKDDKAEEIKAKIEKQDAIMAVAKQAITNNVELIASSSQVVALLKFRLSL